MVEQQTSAQRQAVDAIQAHVQNYLDMRYTSLVRISPPLERIWDDLVFQTMTQFHNIISNNKAFGPLRYHVAETLVGDDERKARDFLNPVHQNSVFPEIIEKEDASSAQKAMEGVLAIHDMRTLFKAVEPQFINTVQLIQSVIWFDLEDAIDLSRVDIKSHRVHAYIEGKLTDAIRGWYSEHANQKEMTDADIIIFELVQIRRSVEAFTHRRANDAGYRRIVCRDAAAHESADALIAALANQHLLVRHLRSGQPLDAALVPQFAIAMATDAAHVTPDRVIAFLESKITAEKAQLRGSLAGVHSGKPYDYKDRQAAELKKKFDTLVAGRELPAIKPAGGPRETKELSTTGASASGQVKQVTA